MKPNQLVISAFLLAALGAPNFSWAKKEHPTPTATQTATATQTSTPASAAYQGQKPYTFDVKWGSLGTAMDRLAAPEDVDIFPDGRIVIADTGNNRIMVWDKDGKPLAAYGSFGTSATWRNAPQFNHPGGVLADPSGKIYVADTLNHRVVVLDDKGLVVSTFGTQGTDKGQFNLPRAMAKDSSDNIQVLDSGNSRIEIFSGLGVPITLWGTFGTQPGLLNVPLGFILNNIDQAIVVDSGNFRVQVFNNNGAPVTSQGWFGEGPYEFKEPASLTLTQTGMIAVTDKGRVQFLNGRFEFVGQWPGKDEISDASYDPRFYGIACDKDNRLYVTDRKNNCLLRLKLTKPPETPVITFKPTPTPQDSDPYGGIGFPIR